MNTRIFNLRSPYSQQERSTSKENETKQTRFQILSELELQQILVKRDSCNSGLEDLKMVVYLSVGKTINYSDFHSSSRMLWMQSFRFNLLFSTILHLKPLIIDSSGFFFLRGEGLEGLEGSKVHLYGRYASWTTFQS